MRKLFPTDRQESFRSAWYRRLLTKAPCIWSTGVKASFLSADFRELHVSLSLSLHTRNIVGTVFGGSIYSSIDPFYMLMLMEILGREYVVWDKSAAVNFLRPIKAKVKCRFLITDELIATIKSEIAAKGQYIFDLPLQYEDEAGKVYATFTKTLYTAHRAHYESKRK